MTRKLAPHAPHAQSASRAAPPSRPQHLPEFTPVPRQKIRCDGWTPDRQRAFIEALADTGSVASACKAVNMSNVGAYQLRRHPEADSFRAAWDAALDLGIQKIEDVAMERALNGVDEPLYSYGKLIGTRKRYNDRLLMFMLRNRAPERFAEGRPKALNAIDAMEKERMRKRLTKQLRKELFAEWEAERAAKAPSPADVRASIDRKIESIRLEVENRKNREWETLSPETRAAWERFEELRDRDLDRLKADEDMRRFLSTGPQKTVNAIPPPPPEPTKPRPPKTRWTLKDESFDP